MIIDKLNWHTHIDYLCTKVSKASGIIKKLKNQLTPNVLKTIYHSLLCSYLRYGILSWGSAMSTALKSLNILNNRAIKAINAHNSIPLTEAYKANNILSIDSMFQFELMKFVHSTRTGKAPKAFENYFIPISHSYQTRSVSRDLYRLPKARTEIGKRCVKYQAAKTWNNLCNSMIGSINSSFNKVLKMHLIDVQNIS